MSRKKNIRRNIASLLLGVFVWIVIGTLVNFHQHHLYGRVLIFHASSSVSLKKDEHSANLNCKKALPTDDYGSPVLFTAGIESTSFFASYTEVFIQQTHTLFLTPPHSWELLRGPPSC